MIWIFHREIADAGSCDNYDDLFQYINSKLMEDHFEFEQIPFERPWSFTFFTPQQVSVIYDNTRQSLLTAVVKEAYEKELGFVEICQRDFENPIEILSTPDLDIEALKKQWCLAYCDAHDYIVMENFSHSYLPTQSQWHPQLQSGVVRLPNYPWLGQRLLHQISPSEIWPKSSPAFQEAHNAYTV